MRIRAAAAALAAAVLLATCGCLVLRLTEKGRRVRIGSGVFRQLSTSPNLALVPARGSTEKITLRPCSRAAGSEALTAAERVCIGLAVENLGYGKTEEAIEVLFYLDGSPARKWILPDPMRPGEIEERDDVSFGPLAPGSHSLRVVIDPENRIAETEKSDNEATVTFLVSAAG